MTDTGVGDEAERAGRTRRGFPWRTFLSGLVAGVSLGLGYVALETPRDGRPMERADVTAGRKVDRPAPQGTDRVYVAIDTGQLFVDAGSTWESLDIAAPHGTFDTIEATKAITRAHPAYDVTAWGAVGDGRTDDTAAIQRALDAAERDGGVVHFPPGEYYATYTLLYGSNTVLRGPGATIAFEPGDPDAAALVSRSFDGSTATIHVRIEGLTIESVDPGKGNGIGIAKAQDVTVQGCRTERLHWHLVDIAGAKDVLVHDCYAANLETAAYQADNLTEAGGLVIEHADGTVEDAIADGSENQNVSVRGNVAEDCGRGVHLHRSGGHDLTVRENVFRRCTDVGILGDGGARWHDVIVADNIVEGDGTSGGIDLQGRYTNLSVEHNAIRHHDRGLVVRPGGIEGGRPEQGPRSESVRGDRSLPPSRPDAGSKRDDRSGPNGDERLDERSRSDARSGPNADGYPKTATGIGPPSAIEAGSPSRTAPDAAAAGITVSDNTVERVGRIGIALHMASGQVSDNYVHDVATGPTGGTQPDDAIAGRGDVASDDGDTAIEDGGAGTAGEESVDTDRDGNVTANTDVGIDTERVGISVRGCDGITVTDNVLRNVGGTAVLVRSGSCDVFVSENYATGFDVAVGLVADGASIRGADVKDNRFVGRSGSSLAVYATGGSGYRIEDNAIAGVKRGGVLVKDSADVHVGNNDATGADAAYGYAIRSCVDVEIHGNTAAAFADPLLVEDTTRVRGEARYALPRVGAGCEDVVVSFEGPTPPATGSFGVGSRVRNTEPAAGDPAGWVCTGAGTPGTWTPYGTLEE